MSPVLVMITSMSVPICNRSHSIGANNGKKNVFLKGILFFDILVRGEPPNSGARNFATKN